MYILCASEVQVPALQRVKEQNDQKLALPLHRIIWEIYLRGHQTLPMKLEELLSGRELGNRDRPYRFIPLSLYSQQQSLLYAVETS